MKRWTLIFTCLLLGAVLGTFATRSYLQGQGQGQAPAPVIPERTSYRDLVKQVMPAVVSLHGTGKAQPQPANPRPSGELPEVTGFGSGFVVDAQGVVLTNYHVVEGLDEVEVRLADGRKFKTKDIRTDPKTDIALVRFMATEALPALPLGDSDAMEIGDRVLAFGAPFGLSGSVTSGIISAKGRSLNVNMYEDFLQTDAAVNPGNSGGPLVNMQGQVIGITSAIKSRSGGFQGVGLAIASNLIRDVSNQLRDNGVVKRGYLGVQVQTIEDKNLALRLGVQPGQGLIVTHVFTDTPGAKAGLKNGDILLVFSGRAVNTVRQLQQVIARVPVGKKTQMTVVRDSKTVELDVTIDEQPQSYGKSRVPIPQPPTPEPARALLDTIGIEIQDLDAATARQMGLSRVEGVLIVKVARGSSAEQGKLQPGMLILQVDRRAVNSAQECRDAVAKGSLEQGILVQVWSKATGTSYVLIREDRR